MSIQNIKYLNRTILHQKVLKLDDIYWTSSWNGRWGYIQPVLNELELISPKTILEIGAYKINLSNISDNMDLEYDFIDVANLNNKIYIQSAEDLPWNIPDKYYDVVVALQVFEHFENKKQSEVFNEVMRVSKNAIISLPYMWNKPEDQMHHMITEEIMQKWTNNVAPEKAIQVNTPDSRKRIIYIFKF